MPIPQRVRGRVRLHPEAIMSRAYALDAERQHHWWPIAPCARVEVTLDRPGLHWQGRAYLDSNWGDAPLESAFARWDWSRAALPRGGTAVLYDIERRAGGPFSLGLRFDPSGTVRDIEAPQTAPLPATRIWRIERGTRADADAEVLVRDTLEDTPFYARSTLQTQLDGQPVMAMHESLSLDRFRTRWVQLLLPFRMPRLAR